MSEEQIKEAFAKLLFEISASQYLGSKCADIMDIDECYLYDVIKYIENKMENNY